MGGSQWNLPSGLIQAPISFIMKSLLMLALVTLVVGDYDREMMQQWERMKSLESCWGEENMKLYTVNIKKAIATCSHRDAPELFLPPFRSSYRFVNTILNGANSMESEKYNFMEKMMNFMMQNQDHQQSKYRFKPYSSDYVSMDNDNTNWMDKMKMKFMMKQMMEKMGMDNMDSGMSSSFQRSNFKDNYNNDDMMKMFNTMFGNNDKKSSYSMSMHGDNSYRKNDPMARMSEFMSMFNSRSKRAAGQATPYLDLGDRLVEKLNEQKREMEEQIGNMTCVLKEMNYLDANNKLDIRGMKKDIEQYTMPSPWFATRYEEMIDTCYEMATNLPSQVEENAIITGEDFGTVNMAEIKSFKKCCAKGETRLCMNQDIKKKIEANFGPLEDILSQTKLTEYQIFPLVIQLLHGEEMEYMMGEF